MTPLHLDILLHYYISSEPYGLIKENPTRYEYAIDLVEKGFLFLPNDNRYNFRITVSGQLMMKRLLEILDIGVDK